MLLRRKGIPVIPSISLRDFHERRNKILVIREVGGVGDILMHRMIFEDMKLQMPECEIHFACPKYFHDIVWDHPFIDRILDSDNIPYNNYIISYNTSSACARYEMGMAPFSGLHRSDIWAGHCGLELEHHDMHLMMDQDAVNFGTRAIREIRKKDTMPAVLVAPISAMPAKNLNDKQLQGLIEGLQMRGCVPYAVHNHPIPLLEKMGIRVFNNISLRNWLGLTFCSDYIVSVDTGCFHMAGGLGKPVVGIFTFADGQVYGKYYEKFELVQKHRKDGNWNCGPCYNMSNCTKSNAPIKPCLTELTPGLILDGVDKLFERFPWDNKRTTSLGVIK